jgi:hypothetical protein
VTVESSLLNQDLAMEAMRTSIFGLAAAGALLCGAVSALAGGPLVLTNRQLDSVTAGGAIVTATTDAQATGPFSLANTTSNSAVTSSSPYKSQPGLTNTAGAADGTAVAVGTGQNFLGQSGSPPPSSGTSVTTVGAAEGNLVVNSTFNRTVQGAGGVTFQAGWTFVYGAWVGI